MSRSAVLGALLLAACGSPPRSTGTDGGPDAGLDAGLCPPNLSPTFSDINARFFQVGCLQTGACHTAAAQAGTLVLETNGYANLVNQRAANLGATEANPPELFRVLPGKPAQSFLVIKLNLTAVADPEYGHGMPYPAPGTTCPEVMQAIVDWIDGGAPND